MDWNELCLRYIENEGFKEIHFFGDRTACPSEAVARKPALLRAAH
jgi:hypothetical protein